MKILKFGGSSLATPDRIRNVGQIILRSAAKGEIVVVVSAFQGITNQLLACARLAERGDRKWERMWQQIVDRHTSAINALLGRKPRARLRAVAQSLVRDLHDALHGVQLLS